MGHFINALIGTSEALSYFVAHLGTPAPTELPFGLVIIPLNERRLDSISMSDGHPIEGFTYLTPAMAEHIALATTGPALYIETEYFGGMGGQSAAYFENGKLTWWAAESSELPAVRSHLTASNDGSTDVGKSPINEGLSRIGVSRTEDCDEFDQIGLQQYRSVKDLGIQ